MFQEDFCWTNVFFCNKRAAIYLKTFYLLSILFSLIYRQFSLIFPLSPHSLFLSFHCRAFFFLSFNLHSYSLLYSHISRPLSFQISSVASQAFFFSISSTLFHSHSFSSQSSTIVTLLNLLSFTLSFL